MQRLYEPPAYDTARTAGAFWEETRGAAQGFSPLNTETQADVAIIGGGYTGLNAALQLAEEHGLSPILLEAAQPGWGASGRNGGFVCLGGAKLSVAAQIRRFGLQSTRAFIALQLAAIERVRDNLARYEINADTRSHAGELCLAHRAGSFRKMREEADFAEKTFGIRHEAIAQAQLAERGLNATGFHGGVLVRAGFALNPLSYADGLTRALANLGAPIHGNSPVTAIRPEPGGYRLVTPGGSVRAKKVIVATNGYSSDDLPPALDGGYLPVISSILTTRPLGDDELAAQGWTSDLMSYDSRNLVHYFRLTPERRMLFGQRGAIRADAAATRANRRASRRDFDRMFPAWRGVETSHHWSGLLCVTYRRLPCLGPLGDRPGLIAAFGYHGNGVAMASQAGRLAGDMAAGIRVSLPDALGAPLAPFPAPRLRRLYLGAAYLGYRLLDAL